MKRRAGVTLMEVLVAIMITGVGLLAILTLFPLGAMEMSQSVKFDRCGHIKHNAAAIANVFNIRQDAEVQRFMLSPGGGLPTLDPTNPSQADSAGYPVFIDPIGWNGTAITSPARDWVGGVAGGAPRRVTYTEQHPLLSRDPAFLNPVSRQQQLLRWNVFLDEIHFRRDDETALGLSCPPGAANGGVERSPRYSWAFVAQMPKARLTTTVDLTVVLYSGRPIDDPTTGERPYQAAYDPGNSSVTLQWSDAQGPPDIRVGNWIMDPRMWPSPRGSFHRVVGLKQTSSNTMDLELLPGPRTGGQGIAIFMENVIEVYDRGEY